MTCEHLIPGVAFIGQESFIVDINDDVLELECRTVTLCIFHVMLKTASRK